MEHIEDGFPQAGPAYLQPTRFFDHDDPAVRAFTDDAVAGAEGDIARAIRLFYAVRDAVRYDPYAMSDDPETYRASRVLHDGAGFCIQKANLLVACTRAVGIPTGLGLSDVTNHLCTRRLLDVIGGKTLFIHHGYAVMLLDGAWVKAAPAFNIELCEKFHVLPTEFDGRTDALFQPYDKKGRRHMEYETDHGIWSDFPHERVIRDFKDFYPDTIYQDLARERARNATKQATAFENERPIT